MSCKEEFRIKNFSLNHPNPSLFVNSQWRVPQVVYLVYRVLVAVFFLVFIILSGFINYGWYSTHVNRIKWFIYLTDWGFLTLTLDVTVEMIVVAYSMCRPLSDEKATPWYIKATWVLYNIATATGLMVTIMYYSPVQTADERRSHHYIAVIFHSGNTVYILINLLITAVPVRIQHFWHPVMAAFTYTIFSLIYDFCGGTNGIGQPYIYTVLNWNADPETAILYSSIAFIVTLVVWIVVYGLYWLRISIAKCCGCMHDDGHVNYK